MLHNLNFFRSILSGKFHFYEMEPLEEVDQVFEGSESSTEQIIGCFAKLGVQVSESDVAEKKRQIHEEIKKAEECRPHRVSFSVNQGGVSFDEEVRDASPIFQRLLLAYEKFADMPALGSLRENKYEFISYSDLKRKVFLFGSSMQKLGIKKGDYVGICMRTREEWTIAAHACQLFGFIIVTIYPTLGCDAVEFILNSVPCKIFFVDSSARNSFHLFQKEAYREITYSCDEISSFKSFSSLLSEGSENENHICLPEKSDTMMVCFTSGTSGEPKGVIHTHESFAAGLQGCYGKRAVLDVGPGDVILGFLPMAHISGWLVDVAFLTSGAAIGFFRGDPKLIVQDIQALRPTVLGSVPRVLNRIHGFFKEVIHGLGDSQKKVFDFARRSKERLRQKGRLHSYWDLIAFPKFRGALGGRVRLIAQGAAPIASSVLEDFQILLSCQTSTIYGMTEIGLVVVSDPFDILDTTSVGCPVSGEIKLTRSDSSNVFRGELCFRGPSLMKGYFNRPELTKSCFDKDGFFHSGDIAKVNDMGCIAIIDRVKALLKLSQGEYVSPERVELACISHRAVAQAFIWGDSLWDFVVGVIVLNPSFNNVDKSTLFDEIRQSMKDFGLSHFEIPRFFHISEKTFDELDLLTPTAKLKRAIAINVYRENIFSLIH